MRRTNYLSADRFSLINLIQEQDQTRQALIRTIQETTDTKIINYCSNFSHPAAVIQRQDIILFHEMLSALDFPEKLDLIIHSPGGIVEVAENIVNIIRDHVTDFRIFVADAAKSAATLIALSSDEIKMSRIAELGPIDPQIFVGIDPALRQPVFRPAWSYINSLKRLEEELRGGRDPNIVIPLVHKIDPTLLDVARNALDYAKSLAKRWLQEYMNLPQQKASEIAEYLSDVSQHLTHSRAIRLTDLQELEINATEIDQELWNDIYQLHMRSTFVLRGKRIKLIECESRTLYGET